MRIIVKIDDTVIRAAAKLMEIHCRDKTFMQKIATVPKFNHTKISSVEVSQTLYVHSLDVEVIVKPYQTFNPFSKVIGYAKGSTIYVNTRKIQDLDVYERCGNFYHEFCHLAGFSHEGNRVTPYNLETVPYKVGQIFEEYLKEKMQQSFSENPLTAQ